MTAKTPTNRDLFGMRCLRCGERATQRLSAKGASALFACENPACFHTAEIRLRACIGSRVYQHTVSPEGFSQWGHRKIPR